MCGGCARDLLSTCPCQAFAEPAREKIRAKMRAGESADQIIAEYEAENGQDSLAVPPNRGWKLRTIYLVPVLGIVSGAVGLAFMLRRWRRGDEDPKPPPSGAAKDAYDARLDDELRDLDG
jgi:cytochrome c-type biogenesis protein CcmH/NrfF